MEDFDLYMSAVRQFTDLKPDLQRLLDSTWTGELDGRAIERARLAWCELRALRTHPIWRGQEDVSALGPFESRVGKHLEVLSVACRLPMWGLIQGDSAVWAILSEELTRLFVSSSDEANPADKREDNISRKLPTNPEVMHCIRYLQRRSQDRTSRRQQIVDFIAESGTNKRSQLQNLERQVRRFAWLLADR